jgi:hypothetical protein
VDKSNPSNPERGKTILLVLTLINTVLVAAVSALQVDVTIRANQANRDSNFYANQVSSSLIYTSSRFDFDMNTYSTYLSNSIQALSAQYSAIQRQVVNDQQGFEALTLEYQIYQTQADRARSLSVFFTDPAYMPASDQGQPDFNTYLSDLYSNSNDLLQKQNAAADSYHRWNNKSDSYVAVLTVLAVAFFLLGVAQMTQPNLRLLFSAFAIGVIGIAIFWTLILLVL